MDPRGDPQLSYPKQTQVPLEAWAPVSTNTARIGWSNWRRRCDPEDGNIGYGFEQRADLHH